MILVEGKSVVVEQDGEPVADITPRERDASRRIGIAKGKLEIPAEFDAWDGEIAGMFGEAEGSSCLIRTSARLTCLRTRIPSTAF